MFYENLYPELGKLFYYVASVDGKVQAAEKESLQKLIQESWKPMEDSVDQFGTDLSVLIDASFEFEEMEGIRNDGLKSFEEFYHDNKDKFTPEIISRVLATSKAIASAYHDKNKDEREALKKIEKIFKDT